jgi:WhiB family transcriptional regulator, redox-sensing transcriptional regulator
MCATGHLPEAGVGGAIGSASVHGTRGSSIASSLPRRSAAIGDVLDSLLTLAEDAFYAAAAASWMPLGACQKEDPGLFFPAGRVRADRTQIDAAKAVCSRCPVRAECLSYARGTGQQDGIWGGTTSEERWESGEIPPASTNSPPVPRDPPADRAGNAARASFITGGGLTTTVQPPGQQRS